MSLYLCCDCGGSKTSAVICDASGNILGRALGGPSNFAYISLDAFISAVSIAVSNALKTCIIPHSVEPITLPPSTELFAAAWFGVSGVDSPAAVASVTPALSTLLNIPVGPRLTVANDTHLLAAPVRMYDDVTYAVAAIAGTGSIAVTFKESGRRLEELGRIGGWGWILGDEGSGFHVGRETIRQMLVEHDKESVTAAPPRSSPLKDSVLEAFGVSDIMEILTEVHVGDPTATKTDVPPHLLKPREKRLSSLSPLVFEAALEKKDEFALGVLTLCAEMFATQISYLLGESTEAAPRLVSADKAVISFGGSLVGIEAYRNMILKALADKGHVFRRVEFIADAAATGAKGLAASLQV